jgi:hypothetical protein
MFLQQPAQLGVLRSQRNLSVVHTAMIAVASTLDKRRVGLRVLPRPAALTRMSRVSRVSDADLGGRAP